MAGRKYLFSFFPSFLLLLLFVSVLGLKPGGTFYFLSARVWYSCLFEISVSCKLLHNFIVLAHNENLYQHRTACLLLRTGVATPVALGRALAVCGFLAAPQCQGVTFEKATQGSCYFRLPFESPVYLKQCISCYCAFFPTHFLSFLFCFICQEMYLIVTISGAQIKKNFFFSCRWT